MKRIILARHGESEFNAKKIIQGHLDSDLTPQGIVQAHLLALELKNLFNIQKIYTSDLRRAYKTAYVIADNLGLEPIKDKRLREMSFGDWEGKSYKDLEEKRFKDWLTNPIKYSLENQEPKERFFSRLKSIWEEIINSEDEEILIVAHGGTIQGLICIVLDIGLENLWAFKHTNASFSLLEYQNGKPQIKILNYSKHLDCFVKKENLIM